MATSSSTLSRSNSSRYSRPLRVITEPRHSNKMHRTRTLSELILLSPRSSSTQSEERRFERKYRFDMDIEVSHTFAQGQGTVDLFENQSFEIESNNQSRGFTNRNSAPVMENAYFFREDTNSAVYSNQSTNENIYSLSENESNIDVQEGSEQDMVIVNLVDNQELDENDVTTERTSPAEVPPAALDRSVSNVVDVLFEIHSALKNRSYIGQRTAASALAASNLVSSVAYPIQTPMPRDEQLEILENTRKMLECAICQEVFTNATEATCCGQIFCKECIERWVSERGSCPMCRETIGFTFLTPARHSQRMANEMKVACPYCSTTMKKATLSSHMVICDKAPVEPPPPSDVALRQLLLSTARMTHTLLVRFLLSPSPVEALMTQCYIRTRGGGNYELYTQEGDVLLCTASRRRQYDMSVSFSICVSDSSLVPRSSSSNSSSSGSATISNSNTDNSSAAVVNSSNPNGMIQIARLEKNYMGSQYTMFDTTGEVPMELGAVQYAATFGKSPRQMRVAIPLVKQLPEIDSSIDGQPSWEVTPWRPTSKDDTILNQVENPDVTRAISLINKPPVWIESLEAYCLDFGGRVAAASVKNFLLSHPDNMDRTLMLFGRTQDRQVYSMDFAHPFSPVQAFAIALSSMDSHLVTFD